MSARADITRMARAEGLAIASTAPVHASRYVDHCVRADRFESWMLDVAEGLLLERPRVYASILGEYEFSPDAAGMLRRMVDAWEGAIG